MLKLREIKFLDIAKHASSETPAEECKSFVADCGRGPLEANWMETVEPVMCCYKLTTIKCSIPFVSGKIYSTMETVSRDERGIIYHLRNKSICSWNSLNNAF